MTNVMTVVSLHLSTGGCAGYLIGSPLLAFVLSFLMSFCCSFAPSSFIFDNFSSSPPAVLLLAIPSAAKQPRRSRLVSPPDAHRSVKYRCPFCGVFHVRMPVAQFSLCPHASCLECIRGLVFFVDLHGVSLCGPLSIGWPLSQSAADLN